MNHKTAKGWQGMPPAQGARIGVLEIAADDDRRIVLTAILAEERLKREQIVLVLPQQNKAFQRPEDFDALKALRRKLQAELIFVTPPGPGPADFARQRRFTVFSSIESFVRSFKTSNMSQSGQPAPVQPSSKGVGRPGGLFGRGKKAEVVEIPNPVARKGETSRKSPQTRMPPGVMPASEVPDLPTQQLPPKSPEPFTPLPPQPPGLPTADEDADTAGELPESIKPRAVVSEHDDQNKPGIHNVGPSVIELGPAAPNVVHPTLSTGQGTGPGSNIDTVDDELPPVQGQSIPSTLPNTPPAMGTDTANRERVSGSSGPSPLELPQPRVAATQVPPMPPPVTPQSTPPRGNTGKTAAVGVSPSNAPATGKAPTSPTITSKPPKTPVSNANRGQTRQQPVPTQPRQPFIPPRTPSSDRNTRPVLIVALVIVILLILFGGGWAALASGALHLPFLASSATVTITPARQTVQDTYLMQGVMSNADPANRQVTVRQLNSTKTATDTVNATGHAKVAAKTATGMLTFRNGSTSPETIAPTPITNANGIQVIADQIVTIPGASTTLGTATVSAHAVLPGNNGNIAAGSISGTCCVGGNFIQVTNMDSFSGGVDAQNYNFLQDSDITPVTNAHQATLESDAQNDMKGRMKSGEQVLGKVNCDDPKTTEDVLPGMHGVNVTTAHVTVSVSCNATVFDANAVQTIAENALKQKASINPGGRYVLAGHIVVTPSQSPNVQQDGSITFSVNAQGVWYYQLTDAMKQALPNMIKGMSKAKAEDTLNAYLGTVNATIAISYDGNTLPTDEKQIMLDVQKVNGL